ncbi:MAG: hypothetical protein ACR2GH_16730 [Pseudonocardia sp.]
MNQEVKVNTWVSVRDSCRIQYHSIGDDQVEVQFGGDPSDFELLFTRNSLARFVELASHALESPADEEAEPVTLPKSS